MIVVGMQLRDEMSLPMSDRASCPAASTDSCYELLASVGRGSFGEVFRARSFTGEVVAIKVIDLELTMDDEIDDLHREVTLMAQCHSPYVVRYLSSYIRDTQLCVVMEYMATSVRDLRMTSNLHEDDIKTIISEVLKGLIYLHGEHKIHRDIKARPLQSH